MKEYQFQFPKDLISDNIIDEKGKQYQLKINSSAYYFSFCNLKSLNNGNLAAIGVGIDRQRYTSLTWMIVLLFLIIAIFSLAIASIISYFLSRNITNPLVSMVNAIHYILDDHFEERVPVNSRDEIGQLASAFNIMTIQLKKTLDSLKDEIEVRKRTEVEIRKTKQLLRNVQNSISSLLIATKADGTITEWNFQASRFTGIPVQQAIDQNVWDLIPLIFDLKSIAETVITTGNEVRLEKKEFDLEDRLYLDIAFFPLNINQEKGLVIKIDDVTEQEVKDEQLRQAQKMETIGTLVGGLVHDFNNVLGGIIGAVSLIKFYITNGVSFDINFMRENVDLIDRSAYQAKDMVAQLLTLSRKQKLTFAPVDLNNSIKHVLKICKTSIDKSVEFHVEYYDKPALVRADPAQIEQILLNLCVNASHAMTIMRPPEAKQGGQLWLTIDRLHSGKLFVETHPEAHEGEYWVIRINDTGVGMDSRTIAKIFDPFFTTKEKGRGTGLGLSMVYYIILQHKGFIDVYSEVGFGSTFNIFLPVLSGTLSEEQVENQQFTIAKGSGTILIVDDEEIVLKLAKNILKECGYTVLTAGNGEEGMEIFEKEYQHINAVLLDMAMPKMSGKEVYLKMKSIKPEIKALLASGYRQDSRIDEALQSGIDDFIQKPYTLVDLSHKIKRILTN
ncbi:MAG: response regulator [Spirochaetes bacterium]|nr:response regulator [Spirochaetota bacterium]